MPDFAPVEVPLEDPAESEEVEPATAVGVAVVLAVAVASAAEFVAVGVADVLPSFTVEAAGPFLLSATFVADAAYIDATPAVLVMSIVGPIAKFVVEAPSRSMI